MLWIALTLPLLPIEAHSCSGSGGGSENQDAPLAILRQHRILLANEAASVSGVQIGQRRSTALALCSNLRIIERDLTRESEVLTELALALLRFTPNLTLVRSADHVDGILLESQSSLRLFGGLPALMHAVHFTVTELGLTAHMASFPTAAGAWLVARSATPESTTASPETFDALATLDRLPVALLDSASPYAVRLKGMGIDQLGQLRHLPRDGVSKRFGTALFDEMDRAYGDAPDPRNWFVAPAEFRARLELHARVESADALFFAAHRLLIQLTGWLCAKQSALRSFTLLLNHETRRNEVPQASIVITLAQASRDLAHLSLLLREHLARTTLAAPVVEIVLHATHVEPLETTNQDLFPSATTSTENLGRLLERLGARLGMQAIRRVRLLEDHRPEIAQRFEAALQSTNPRLSRQSAPVADPDHHLSYVSPRPSWLLSRPLRLTVRDHKPFHHCRLHLVAGPERIEAGWWDATAVRDYFVAENDDAELLWVFRERLTGGNESWYLHGKFA